jgi:O-methyltransferase involved in polyketide biosynthesis
VRAFALALGVAAAALGAWLFHLGWVGALLLGLVVVLVLSVGLRGGDERPRDLAVTALYTSAAWRWGGLPDADLFASREAQAVFDTTNLALALLARGAPALPEGLVQRHRVIDRLLAEAGVAHVLELAAGLSRRGVTVSGDAAVTYTEVDRAHVLARKRALLERTPAGRAVLARPNLRLVAADLAVAPLADLVGAPAGAPLVVIAEGLFMYLDAEAQRAAWRRVRALFEGRSGRFLFDLVPPAEQPAPGRAGRLLERAMRRATGGATIVAAPRTRADISADLEALGFAVRALDPAALAEAWGLPYRARPTQQLVWECRVG